MNPITGNDPQHPAALPHDHAFWKGGTCFICTAARDGASAMPREMKLLDHGYLRFIEAWGSDARIIEAARMSTDKGFQGWGPTRCPGPNCMPVEHMGDVNYCEHRPRCDNGWLAGDEKLLAYLWRNAHADPTVPRLDCDESSAGRAALSSVRGVPAQPSAAGDRRSGRQLHALNRRRRRETPP